MTQRERRWFVQSMATRLTIQAREAGFEVVRVEQLRSNRWLLTARDGNGQVVFIMAQQRPLIGSSDVQDLAEVLQLSRQGAGFLLAVDGAFSPEARRTAAELRRHQIHLCTALPANQIAPAGHPALETA